MKGATKLARSQVFLGEGRGFATKEFPLPQTLSAGEVLVEISLATVCGSDLHTVDGRRECPTPCVLGHEAVGTVCDASEGRAELSPGDRVTWSLVDSCGHCSMCRQYELPQKCERLFKYGHAPLLQNDSLNGCYATHILLRPGTTVVKLPSTVTDDVAAPANCALATMVNVMSHLPRRCDSILIQGAGMLGLYGCSLAKHRGVAKIFCADINAERLKFVTEFGATPIHAVSEACPKAVDAVIEVSGQSSVVEAGVRSLRTGGHYVWAGMVHPATPLAITGESVVRKCLTIHGVHNYAPIHLRQAVEFLADTHDRFPFKSLVSPPLMLDSLPDALALARTGKWPRVAVRP